ncbi:hypothetical protein chiPu_0017430 [Chiloscyllium punctatum]|uniref:Cystatin domain-containing protein n=1 Tax=Chiloscyllium punctatum TaxID=137246 RepID=A0A401RFX8_CHIPU|nr:hypothetical protein [Chiloscyllium punctatum]
MKAIIFILVAAQIAYSYGQSLDQAVDDAIDQLNEDLIIDNIVTVVKQINVDATLKKQGLVVRLKLQIQETNCSKETANLFSICVPKPEAVSVIDNASERVSLTWNEAFLFDDENMKVIS